MLVFHPQQTFFSSSTWGVRNEKQKERISEKFFILANVWFSSVTSSHFPRKVQTMAGLLEHLVWMLVLCHHSKIWRNNKLQSEPVKLVFQEYYFIVNLSKKNRWKGGDNLQRIDLVFISLCDKFCLGSVHQQWPLIRTKLYLFPPHFDS